MNQRRMLMVGTVGIGALLSTAAGFIFGGVWGNVQAYRLRFLDERNLIVPELSKQARLRNIRIEENSNGTAYLAGTVESSADLDSLRLIVIKCFGELRSNEILGLVEMQSTPAN